MPLIQGAKPSAESTPHYQQPWLWHMRSSKWFITTTVSMAVFTESFLYSCIGPVFPSSLADRVHIPDGDLQKWLSVLFSMEAVGLLCTAPIFGYISDRLAKRRSILLVGAVILVIAQCMLFIGTNLALLIIGRFLAGVSSGAVWCIGLALIADTVDSDKVAQMMGFVAAANSVAGLLGPVLGGIVYERAGYTAVFAIGFGLIGLDCVLRLLLIERGRVSETWQTTSGAFLRGDIVVAQHDHHRDPEKGFPSATITQTTATCNSRTNSTPSTLTNSDYSECSTAIEMTCSTSPLEHSKRTFSLPILLKSHRMQAAFVANTVNSMIFTGFDVTLPLFVESTFKWNSLGAGVIFLALMVPSFAQPLYGWVVDRYGAKYPAAGGLFAVVVPYACLRFVTENCTEHKILLCMLLFLIGAGAALSLAATMAEFTFITEDKERKTPGSMGKNGAYAQSYGLFNVSWALGAILGSYLSGLLSEHAGWGTMGWSFAALCGAASIPTLLFCGGWIATMDKNGVAQQKLQSDSGSEP